MPSVSVGNSAVQLQSASAPVTTGVQIKASTANTGKVYIGYSSAVTANTSAATDGMQLAAGEGYFVPRLKATDVLSIWVIADSSSQTVFFDVL